MEGCRFSGKTDHETLKWVLHLKKRSGRLARCIFIFWSLKSTSHNRLEFFILQVTHYTASRIQMDVRHLTYWWKYTHTIHSSSRQWLMISHCGHRPILWTWKKRWPFRGPTGLFRECKATLRCRFSRRKKNRLFLSIARRHGWQIVNVSWHGRNRNASKKSMRSWLASESPR